MHSMFFQDIHRKKGISSMGYEEQSWFQNGYSTVSDSFQIIEIFVQKKTERHKHIEFHVVM